MNKLEKLEFDDCSFAAKKGQYHVGETLLVIRSGAILPRDLARQLGALRVTKKHKVQVLSLSGIISDCVVFPLVALHPNSELRIDPKIYIGFEVGDRLGIVRSTDFNRNFVKKEESWLSKLRKRLSW